MEEEAHHKYWIWMMKRKQNDDNPLMNYSSLSGTSSWDDKAFTQEYSSSATRCVEGYIWPPRSYSCSFCMREFRSAQALGGHMNVHRRDRAMLKQSLISPHTASTTTTNQVSHSHQNHNPHHHHSNISLDNYNLDPNCSFPPLFPSRFVSSNNNSRVSATKDKPFLFPFPSSPSSSSSTPCSNSSFLLGILDSKLGSERNLREEEDLMWLGRDNDDDDDDDNHVETDLCVGLNSVVGRNYKRTKMAMPPPPPLPFFIKHCHLQSEVIELKVGSSMEDLDLELRLGDSPNVN